uniref:N-acetyltransferase 9 n=1 Tax=Gorilla gorilla gorilla TaxID=9595 RepID=A0A2I2Z821_GORGO
MRLNQNTLLLGKKVVLVPYTSEHVPRYHEWMKSEELQRLTASEPLTLEQEYAMQRSWREDADKCTFIVLDAEKWQTQSGATEESCMVGDVNLFLTDLEDPTVGEIEVMIAGGGPPVSAPSWSSVSPKWLLTIPMRQHTDSMRMVMIVATSELLRIK